MKFQRAEIYGFGKWVDRVFDFSDRSFIALYGENESGKSTLQQFILYMLFGLPPRMRNFYKPKNSNRIGGMLTIKDELNGLFTIERVGDELNCYISNGKTEDEDWLREQLKGLTREVYESIYSFSALDLSEIRTMKADQLSDVLFSVGLTGATNIYDVEKKLESKIGELFKRTGRRPLINEQITKLNNIHSDMMKYKEKESTYRHKKTLKDELLTTLTRTEKELTEARLQLITNEKIEHVIPFIHEYDQLTEKLNALPSELTFPEDGVNRYESLKMNLLPAKSEYAILQKNRSQYEEVITEQTKEMYEDEVYELAESIMKEKNVNENNLREITELEKRHERATKWISEQLQNISIEKAELEEVVLPFHLEATWTEISDLNIELQTENSKLADDLQVINEEMNRLKDEQIAIDEKTILENDMNQLRKEVLNYDAYHNEIKKYTTQQEKFLLWEAKRTKTAKTTFVIASSLAAISLLIGLVISNNNFYTLAVFLGLAGITQFVYVKNSIKEMQNNTAEKPAETAINERERERYEQIIYEQERLKTDKVMIENEVKRLNFAHLQWEERKRLFTQREKGWFDRVETERYQYPFLIEVNPAYWPELLRIIIEVKQYMHEQKAYDEKLTTLTIETNKFDDQIRVLAKKINSHLDTISLDEIEQLIEARRSHVQTIKEYKKLLEEVSCKQQDLAERIKVYEEEIRTLYNVAKVSNEEAYFKVGNDLSEKRKVTEERIKIEQQISTMFPQDFKDELLQGETSYDKIELIITELKEEIKRNESIISDVNKQLATVNMEIEQLEMSEDNSKTALRYQVERDKLNELAKKWSILKVAQSTLLHAKNAYQEKHLTEVIVKTATYFEQLTNGIYRNVFAPTTTKNFTVEASDYIRYTVDELSQGTIDQLYVSLRLAISKVMSEKFIIPLMIDDAFVHFDERRTDETLHLIQQIGEEQQIILFTCKRDIAKKVQATHIVDNEKVLS